MPLILSPHPHRPKKWLLREAVRYLTDSGDQITVAAGYVTDGASIPRLLWSLVGPPLLDGRVAYAAVIHDALYDTQGAYRFTRRECDRIFHESLCRFGVNPLKSLVYYIGLRLGGWWPWRRVKCAHKAAHLQFVRILPAE